jgi:hypothetical protein
MGFGWGRGAWCRTYGGGRGWRNWFHAAGQPGWMRFGGYAGPYRYPSAYQTLDPDLEKQALRDQAEALQSQLDVIKKRLSEVEAGTPAE